MTQPLTDESFYVRRASQDFGPYSVSDLQAMARGGQLRRNGAVRRAGGESFPAKEIPWVFSDKSYVLALALGLLLGSFGADRFYLGHWKLGLAKLVTLGGLGVWALIDVLLIAFRQVRDSHGRPLA
jgi:TM2 domain-containing membrane protein YozV